MGMDNGLVIQPDGKMMLSPGEREKDDIASTDFIVHFGKATGRSEAVKGCDTHALAQAVCIREDGVFPGQRKRVSYEAETVQAAPRLSAMQTITSADQASCILGDGSGGHGWVG